MLWTLTMVLPRESIIWKKSYILARDAKIMKMCGKALGVSWWMESLGKSLGQNPRARRHLGLGIGTSWWTPFTMICPRIFQTLYQCYVRHSVVYCPVLSTARWCILSNFSAAHCCVLSSFVYSTVMYIVECYMRHSVVICTVLCTAWWCVLYTVMCGKVLCIEQFCTVMCSVQ